MTDLFTERSPPPRTVAELATMMTTWHEYVDEKFSDLKDQIITLKDDVANMKTEVKPVVDAMDKMESGIKAIGWLGSKVMWLAVVIGAIASAWAVWKK